MADPNEVSEEQRSRLFEAWKVSEDVAMHFNNLLLGFRLKAIGGIAVGAVVGIGLKVGDSAKPVVVLCLFVALMVIWLLVWAADFFYYYRLLAGAVDEILRLEKKLGDIHLSHLIERRVQGDGRPEGDIDNLLPCQVKYLGKFPSWPFWVFYSIPVLILLGIVIWFAYAACSVAA